MKEITATGAARNFSELLDNLEHWKAGYVIFRKGKPVAHIQPIVMGTGLAIKDLLVSAPPDTKWRSELDITRDLLIVEDRH